MERTRVGAVEYLNTAPLIEGLARVEGLELVPMVPAAIGPALAAGEIDLGLVSVIDVARSPEPLTILPVGMIGCDGPTLTVRVSSRVPVDRIETVHADTESHTSVALCRIIFERAHGRRVSIEPLDAAGVSPGELPDTVLRIGDKVVTRPLAGEGFGYELDLGEAWHAWTGLPMVYAAWACRSQALDGEDRPRLQMAAALLDRQRRHNAGRLDWIASRWAAARGWPLDIARAYLSTMLRYDLDARSRAGLARFLEESAGLGLVDSPAVALWDSAAMAAR